MANADNGSDTLAPTAASNLVVDERTASSLTVSWEDASDTGGSGLDRYAVTVDGRVVQTVDAATTQTTLSDLAAETSYEVGVTAFDAANNESYTVVTSATTAADDGGGSGTGSGSGDGTGSGSGGETGSGSGGETGSESGDGTDSGTGSSWWDSGSGGSSDTGSDSGSGWWNSGSGSDSDSDTGSGWW